MCRAATPRRTAQRSFIFVVASEMLLANDYVPPAEAGIAPMLGFGAIGPGVLPAIDSAPLRQSNVGRHEGGREGSFWRSLVLPAGPSTVWAQIAAHRPLAPPGRKQPTLAMAMACTARR